ncbi:MAG TPA: translation initiation factor IF-2 N-terminal domain-containing protein, partial [Acidimicrobiales bacterium]
MRVPRPSNDEGLVRENLAAKIRVHELAKELGLTNKECLDLCLSLGIGVKTHSSGIEEAQADRVRRRAQRDGLTRPEQPSETAGAAPAKTSGRQAASSEQAPVTSKSAARKAEKATKAAKAEKSTKAAPARPAAEQPAASAPAPAGEAPSRPEAPRPAPPRPAPARPGGDGGQAPR